MKLLICGKGGSGKSTLAVLLAKAFVSADRSVLLVDADESNLALHRLAGADNAQTLMDYLGGREALRGHQNPGLPGASCSIFYQESFCFSDIPTGCISEAGGVRLLKVGKVQRFSEGCACPMGGVLRQLLTHVQLADRDRVIIDTAAGVEHFGRGIEKYCDGVVGVIDPSFESFKLATAMDRIASEVGLHMVFVLNKADKRVKAAMGDYLSPDRIIGEIPMSDALFAASLEGAPLDHRLPAIEALCRRLDAQFTRDSALEPGPC